MKSASSGPVTNKGQFSFGGIADSYFAAVFLDESNAALQVVSFTDTVPTPRERAPHAPHQSDLPSDQQGALR